MSSGRFCSPVRNADQSTASVTTHLSKFKVFKDQGPRSTKLRLGEVVDVEVNAVAQWR